MDLPSHRRRMRFVRNERRPKAMRVGPQAGPADELPPPPAGASSRIRDLIPEDAREAAFALGKRTKAKARRRRRRRQEARA